MCSRHMLCYFLIIENYCSLVGIFCTTEVIGELYLVRSTDENVGGSVVVWALEVFGKPYYVRPTDENVGGSVVVIYSGYRK